jgi:hypothetical protein
MLTLTFSDVNEAYCEVQTLKGSFADWEETRNGRALVFNCPVLIEHTCPDRRVLFDPIRDANPFFHYMEAIWMLSGSDGVAFPAKFAKQIAEYSDDGRILRGAYGHRWRNHFGVDQIDAVVEILRTNPNSRRAVIAMWDPVDDLNAASKDLPCNTHIYFALRSGYLNMTVCNRSNDLVWGMLGANIVHLSILQEYIAGALEAPVGSLFQFTNNLHIYEGWENKFSRDSDRWYRAHANYNRWLFCPNNLQASQARLFVTYGLDGEEEYDNRILTRNALPMLEAWEEYRSKDPDWSKIFTTISKVYDDDWRFACIQWMLRRHDAQ